MAEREFATCDVRDMREPCVLVAMRTTLRHLIVPATQRTTALPERSARSKCAVVRRQVPRTITSVRYCMTACCTSFDACHTR